MVQYNNLNKVMKIGDYFNYKAIFIILLCNIFFVSCQKDNHSMAKIIGKWQLVERFGLGYGVYSVAPKDQIIEEYTRRDIRILYDYLGNETARCFFSATESDITIYGENSSGTKWESSYKYWFSNDTLIIRHDGGTEFYDDYFIRIK